MKKYWLVGLATLALSGLGLAQDRSNTLIYGGDWSDLVSLDPQISYEFAGSLVTDNVYETLVKFEGADLATPKPSVAESWKVEKGANEWKLTFNLKRGTKFSTGRELTAKDVVYSFERALALKGPGSFLFFDIAQLKPGGTKAVNPYTVEISIPRTASPGSFIAILTFNIGGIVDSEEVAKNAKNNDWGKEWLTNNSAGSGPYRVVRWDRGSQVLMEANPNANPKPKIQRIILREIKEPTVLRTALEAGDVDIADSLTPEAVKALQGNNRYRVLKVDNLRIQYLGMNVKQGSPFANAKVREAVRWSINQDEIIGGLLQGDALKIQTVIPKGFLGYNPDNPYKFDPVRAKQLLTEAGFPNGLEFDFTVSTGSCVIPCTDLAAKLQADFAKAGLKANIKAIANPELLKGYRAQDLQMVLVAWGPDFPDPDGNATPFGDFNAKSLAWRNSWNNPAAIKMAGEAALETDPAERVKMYKQLTELVMKEGPFAILFQPVETIVLSSKIGGFVRSPIGTIRFENITKQP